MNEPRNGRKTGIERRPQGENPTDSHRTRLSRRRLLQLTTLGVAGVVGASSGAAARSLPHTLSIDGDGSYTAYRFSVSDDLEGAGLSSEDSIEDSTATGAVGGGRDSYRFSGNITEFELDGDAILLLDGERVDPAQLRSHTLVIDGNGGYTSYAFTVSGYLEGVGLSSEDSITDSTATGAVGGGRDSYSFSGEITDFSMSGDATVYLDGEEIDSTQFLPHTLSIDGDGSYTAYRVSVSGTLRGVGLSSEDSITGSTATGAVGGGRDSYAFSGEITEFDMDGDATLLLDGEEIDPIQFLPHTLTIDGNGGYTSYAFTVSGDLEGVGLTSEDSITGSSATGGVGGGRDSYAFSGDVTDFDLDGDATVYLDDEVATGTPFLTNTLTVEGTGSYSSYSFTVSGDIEPESGLSSEDRISESSATGAIRAGRDSYSFSGEVIALDVNGDATVYVNGEHIDPNAPVLGVFSGLSDTDFETIDHIEDWQEMPYAVQNLFVPWNASEGHMNWFFDRVLPKIWANGRVPLITWEPYTPGVRTASVDTQSLVESDDYLTYIQGLAETTPDDIEMRVENGEYDSYIDTWASRLRDWLAGPDGRLGTADDRRAYLRFAHEMNGDWYPWSPTVGDSSPESYIGMWRRVRSRFEEMGIGATNLQWMWCVNADDVGEYSAEQLYPGDAYVDWLSIDGYQWGESMDWSHWESPETIFSNMLGRVRNIADKPVCIAETASTSKTEWDYDPERKDEWIREAFEYFEEEDIDMWCWFNEDKETDWAMFDGVRGTETVVVDGELLNAYAAYREAVDEYPVTAGTTNAEPMTTGVFTGKR